MKRRDILKQAGALALGLPAMKAAGLVSPAIHASTGKDLIVTFAGPFCYWLLASGIKVMAPPVGTDFSQAAHQAWTATSANETTLHSKSGGNPPDYTLTLGPTKLSPTIPIPTGTKMFSYEQGTPLGKNPLFNLTLPFPDKLIGNRPTGVTILPPTQGPQILAAGLTCYYKDIDLDQVRLSIGSQTVFTPCFNNDVELPCASLGIFLTRVNQQQEHTHFHAKQVWLEMLKMYPWMQDDIKGIDFPPFDPAACYPVGAPPAPPQKRSREEGAPGPQYGPGNDCEVAIMLLTQPSQTSRPKRT